ncbi:MAG: efflux RND transporter periplasmic adaptor subunit, partial [Gemmatimonadetes bacterium]|nr:efflux RND transporter periplasmic adaptor subunit [Gemmatimonadota bacterium]
EPIIRPVRSQAVFVTGAARVRSFTGTARASKESQLSFKVAGTVARVSVAVGDLVSAGAHLASLDDGDFRLQMQEAEAQLASTEAQARNADANYARVRALYENRNASLNDLDAARAASESARESVNSIQKRLELARMQLGYTQLSAPYAGSISQVRVETNENVQPGQAVAVLMAGSQLEVEVGVPEVLIAQVREGDEVTVRFEALADRSQLARVTEIGVGSMGMATSFPVTVLLDHVDPDCRPGMTAEVDFQFESVSSRERLLVPAVAVGEDRQGRYVWVVRPAADGLVTVHRTPVTVGELGPEGLEILEGLSDGDRVVTAGVSRVIDGQTVRLL